MIRILHLSDLHYDTSSGEHHHFATKAAKGDPTKSYEGPPFLGDAVGDALEEAKLAVDAIVISGDLTWSASEQEFEIAVAQIEKLRSRFGLGKNALGLVPGNHDADWNKTAVEERFEQFDRAFNTLTNRRLIDGRWDLLSLNTETEGIDLLLFNSAIAENEENAGIGVVGETTLRSVLKDKFLPSSTSRIPRLRALCIHHHLLPITYVERNYFASRRKRTSVTLDAKAVLDLCQEHGVPLVIHGHQHQPNLACYHSFDPLSKIEPDSHGVWIASAGSAGVSNHELGAINRRHFQVLEFAGRHSDVTCLVHSFVSDNGNPFSFRLHGGVPICPTSQVWSVGCQLPIPCPSAMRVKRHTRDLSTNVKSGPDRSDLFLLLLRTDRCAAANAWLRHCSFSGVDTPVVKAVFDLYGEYDLLVKTKATAQSFHETFMPALRQSGFFGRGQDVIDLNGRVLDIDSESYPEEIEMHPLSATDRSIRAFIRFTDVENRGAIANICLAAAMHARNAKPGYWVALTGFYTTLAGEAVAEFFLGCGAYSALNEVVLRIESHLEVNARNSRKVTLLSQETWEKCAR